MNLSWLKVKPIVYLCKSHYVVYLLPLNVLVKFYTQFFTGYLRFNLWTTRSFWSLLTTRMFCCSFLLLRHWWDVLVSTMWYGCSCWREEGTWALSSDETESGGKWTTIFTFTQFEQIVFSAFHFVKNLLICSFLFLAVDGHRSLVFCNQSAYKELYHVKPEQNRIFKSNQWQNSCICLTELYSIMLIYKVVCYLSNYLPMISKKIFKLWMHSLSQMMCVPFCQLLLSQLEPLLCVYSVLRTASCFWSCIFWLLFMHVSLNVLMMDRVEFAASFQKTKIWRDPKGWQATRGCC